MIPAAFDYQRATSLDDALAAIAGGDAKVLAGGMSLLPLMKLRLAQPGKLVDIGGLDELKGAGPTADGGYEVGALATYADVLASAPTRHLARVHQRHRRHPGPQPRHDRWGDQPRRSGQRPAGPRPGPRLPSSSCAPRVASGPSRWTASSRAPSRPASSPTSCSSRASAGRSRPGAGGAYRKLEHPASGYSIVGVAAVVAASGGSVTHARVALTGVGEVAYRAKAVEDALLGSDGSAGRRRRGGRARRRRARPSTATSTRIASIERAWPWSTPGARSRPRSAASAAGARIGAPGVRVERVIPVDACPGASPAPILTRDLDIGGRQLVQGPPPDR